MITLTEKLSLQPTLSLYLGGSGVLVGEFLMQMMEELGEQERAFIEPFFIDSQEPAIVDHERARHYCYTNLAEFDGPVYAPFTQTRFPENRGEHPIISSAKGSGVTRIFGAASLVACIDDFKDLIELAVGRLRAVRTDPKQSLQVFLTASSCGGTGAGMILDAAALVRHFFRSHNEDPNVYMFLIGPTVYFDDAGKPMTEEQKSRMQASTYALLKELNHFADGNSFRSAYRLRDQTIEIGNTKDDDRLFDWVYYIDGRGEQTGASRSVEEVAWSIAEAQIHLTVSEVGRKITEALPNQREQRTRGYAENYVHPHNKEDMPHARRTHLEVSSRKAFLASFAVRNLRFPIQEIKRWFRLGWVCDGLKSALRRDRGDTRAAIDQFDELLGYQRGVIQPSGLLADLDLEQEQLLAGIDLGIEKVTPILGGLSIEKIIEETTAALARVQSTLDDMKASRSLMATAIPSNEKTSITGLISTASSRWSDKWHRQLEPDGNIAARLWDVAWNPASGRGLRFLNELILRTARVLTELAAKTAQRPNLSELTAEVDETSSVLVNLRKKIEAEQKKPAFWWHRWRARRSNTTPYTADAVNKAKRLVTRINNLQSEIARARTAYIAAMLAPRVWSAAATALKEWRDTFLRPAIIAADNAYTLATNRWKLARAALKTHQGTNARGRWTAYTTVQLADDTLLASLAKSFDSVDPVDLVVAPLGSEGISREQERLNFRSLAQIDCETTVDMLIAHVTASTDGSLKFLDNGWMIDNVAERLKHDGAKILDVGAEPLTSFSRPAVGQMLHGCFLTPPDLVLPPLFGRVLPRLAPMESRDRMQLGVVSFVFGIPPNALSPIRELFEQYTYHLGDQARNRAHDRYPLHVFLDAPERFHEPYSPLDFLSGDENAKLLAEAAHRLWGNNVRLVIRAFDASKIATDSDLRIELTEKIISHLAARPNKAEAFFRQHHFAELESLCQQRKHLNMAQSSGNGNGATQASHSSDTDGTDWPA